MRGLIGLEIEDKLISSREKPEEIIIAETGAAFHAVNWTALYEQVEPELTALLKPS